MAVREADEDDLLRPVCGGRGPQRHQASDPEEPGLRRGRRAGLQRGGGPDAGGGREEGDGVSSCLTRGPWNVFLIKLPVTCCLVETEPVWVQVTLLCNPNAKGGVTFVGGGGDLLQNLNGCQVGKLKLRGIGIQVLKMWDVV